MFSSKLLVYWRLNGDRRSPHRHQHLQGFHCEEALGRQHGHPALVGIVDAGLGGKEDGKTMANPKKS